MEINSSLRSFLFLLLWARNFPFIIIEATPPVTVWSFRIWSKLVFWTLIMWIISKWLHICMSKMNHVTQLHYCAGTALHMFMPNFSTNCPCSFWSHYFVHFKELGMARVLCILSHLQEFDPCNGMWFQQSYVEMSDVSQKPMYSIIEKFCNPKTFQQFTLYK